MIQPAFLRPERAFLFAGLVWGICFLFLTPVNQVPDEGNHFFRACQISQGDMIASSNGTTLGGYIAKGIRRFSNHYNGYLIDKTKRFTLNEMAGGTVPFEWSGKLAFSAFPNTALYSPVCYLPQAAGIFTARLFTTDLWLIHRMGRGGNLLFWLFCIYASIRIVPHFKWLITGVSLLPMNVSQAASMSPDTIIYGVILLFISMTLYLFYLEDIPTLLRRACWLIPFFILIPLCKNVYTPVLCLALLLPWKLGRVGKREWTIIALLAFSSVLSYGAWSFVVQTLLEEVDPIETIYGTEPGLPKINPIIQLRLVMQDPVGFLHIILHSVIRFTDIWYPTCIGVFGWLDIRYPSYVYHLIWLYLVILALLQGGQSKVSRIPIITGVSLSGTLMFLHFFLAMYLTWCNVGDQQIENLQGRYFTPMLVLYSVALASLSGLYRPYLSGLMVMVVSQLTLLYGAGLVLTHYYPG